jgi:hypothetical protein
MGLDDGEWIRDEAAGAAGNPGAAADRGMAGDDGWPVDGWPGDSWPGDERPGGAQPGGAQPGGAQPGGAQRGGAGKGRGHGGASGFSVRVAAVVAVLAAAAGVAAGLFLVKGTPVASTADGATPSASAPAGSSTGLPALPGLSRNGNGQLQMLLTGRVLAVSGTSITIGGNGPSVTAAVTSATTITGTVHGIGGISVGNEVSAQITGTASHLTATAIQDPAGNSTS